MPHAPDGLEFVEFATIDALRDWIAEAGVRHPGVWVRLARSRSHRQSATFHDLLAEDIARGWSERGRR